MRKGPRVKFMAIYWEGKYKRYESGIGGERGGISDSSVSGEARDSSVPGKPREENGFQHCWEI